MLEMLQRARGEELGATASLGKDAGPPLWQDIGTALTHRSLGQTDSTYAYHF